MYIVLYGMTSTEDFKYALTLWDGKEFSNIIERDVKIDLEIDKIIAIAGARRSGKTYVMFQCMNILLKKGIKRDNIIYVNFENERLTGIEATDLDNLLVAHHQLFNPEGTIYIFLDEIQNVANWEKWVRKIYDTRKYRLIITGSSSRLLSAEIASSLAGRNLTYVIYPFSFEEFLLAKGLKVDKLQKYSFEKGKILKELDEFLEFGSFPEVALTSSLSRKLEILSSYFDAIFFKDIIRRYKVREVGELDIFLKIVSTNYSSYISSVRIFHYFKSIGFSISRITIMNFLEKARSVFLVQLLNEYSKSMRNQISRQSKSYIIDIGISRLFADIDKGRALENAVFLELLRRKGPLSRLNHLKLKSGKEVDFVLGGEKNELLQVSYQVSSGSTRARETEALVEAATNLGLTRGTIVTYDFESQEKIDGIQVEYIPFWQWAIRD